MRDTSITGLSQNTLDFIRSILVQYQSVSQAVIFGSRAKGTFREGSDIDLCLKTDTGFSHEDLLHIRRAFDESALPYEVDILLYETLSNRDLVQHIQQVGIPVYNRQV
ncbi:MAG: nucleotidyltransferase domain-containing protein [Treponema sp.]|nr:nucleotidyltransferase domain-containing protein [Treponema sp.]